MADPVIEFYETDDTTLITNSAVNPLAFSNTLDVGASDNQPTSSAKFPMHLWNDNGGGAAADQAVNIKMFIKDGTFGNTGQRIVGTVLNGSLPFFKARSFGSFGAVDDNQVAYTITGGVTALPMGPIASNQNRHVWVLLDIPADAVNDSGIVNKILLTYDSTP